MATNVTCPGGSADCIYVTGIYDTIDNLTLHAPVKTGGFGINSFLTQWLTIENFLIDGLPNGINLNGAVTAFVRHGQISNPAASTGDAILVGSCIGVGVSNCGNDQWIEDVTTNAGSGASAADASIRVYNSGLLTITNSDFIWGINGLKATPGNGQISWTSN